MSPNLAEKVPAFVAGDVPYLPHANRLQTLNVYTVRQKGTGNLSGLPLSTLPGAAATGQPRALVHVHGGAWRDPNLTARSVEATAAHAFTDPALPISVIVGINYTVSQMPDGADSPYDAIASNHVDPAREAVHPQHVSDVLAALSSLRALGLADDSYILSAHSAGACIAAQALFASPTHFGLRLDDPPRPAAFVGVNGLYDLPALVTGLDAPHAHLRADYESMLKAAFGAEPVTWQKASPAHLNPAEVEARVKAGLAPQRILLDQSLEDQLVPINQRERFKANLSGIAGLQVVDGHRAAGGHTEVWQSGLMLWRTVLDAIDHASARSD